MPEIILADSHAHLDLPEYDHDRHTVIQAARQAGVGLILNIGISLENSRQALATAQAHDGIYAAVGIHPHGAGSITAAAAAELIKLLDEPKVRALGEIGLDFYRRRAPEAVQQEGFRRLLEAAREAAKPVIIHTREATAATLEILRAYAPHLAGGVMHCFSGTYDEARAFVDLGFMISFSGVLTYPKADGLRETARKLPLDLILIETDAPYLAPQARRGKRNEPAYVRYTAETLAQVKGLSLAAVARATYDNTRRWLGLDGGQG